MKLKALRNSRRNQTVQKTVGTARQYEGGDGRRDGQDYDDESQCEDDDIYDGCHLEIINRSSRQWVNKTILPEQGELFCSTFKNPGL